MYAHHYMPCVGTTAAWEDWSRVKGQSTQECYGNITLQGMSAEPRRCERWAVFFCRESTSEGHRVHVSKQLDRD